MPERAIDDDHDERGCFDIVGKSSRLSEGEADDVHDARGCLPESAIDDDHYAGGCV